MRYFLFVLLILVGMWSAQSHAGYNFMRFKIGTLGKNQYDYSYVWNPASKEATLRVGLVANELDPVLKEKEISFSAAKSANFVSLDLPEISQDCSVISQWHFEYQPQLPNYLMFMTLKGEGCQWVAQMFDVLQIRMRFMSVPLEQAEPADVMVDINR